MGLALTRPSRSISRQASCRLAPSDETVRDTYRLHGAPARSVPSRGPIGGLGGYVVTVRLCGGSPGPQRCGTNQYIGADHATKQGHEGRRSVAPVGPIRLQLALEVVYEVPQRHRGSVRVRSDALRGWPNLERDAVTEIILLDDLRRLRRHCRHRSPVLDAGGVPNLAPVRPSQSPRP